MEAAKAIIKNPLTIISGRGGTGKTQVVQNTVLYFVQHVQQVAAVAAAAAAVDPMAVLLVPHWHGQVASSVMEALKGGPGGFEVLYTTPTGKAAHVLRTRVSRWDADVRACTLHQVLAAARRRSDQKFSNVSALVVDEFSMVPLEVRLLLSSFLL